MTRWSDLGQRLAARAPVSTVRAEIVVVDDVVSILAVPTMSELASFEYGKPLPGLETPTQDEVLTYVSRLTGEINTIIHRRRRLDTRPDGTCPRCAGPLDAPDPILQRDAPVRWCPACEDWVRPAAGVTDPAELAELRRRESDPDRDPDRYRGRPS